MDAAGTNLGFSPGTRHWDRRGVGNYLTRLAMPKQSYC